MELTINVDALDKTASAVESASNRTAVAEIEALTIGNIEPMTLRFCDDTGATPSFVTDAGTVVSIGLGIQDVNGRQVLASNSALTISSSTRVGTLNMDNTTIRNAAFSPYGCYCNGFAGIWLTLEIRRVTTVTGTVTAQETLGLLRVFCAAPVMPSP